MKTLETLLKLMQMTETQLTNFSGGRGRGGLLGLGDRVNGEGLNGKLDYALGLSKGHPLLFRADPAGHEDPWSPHPGRLGAEGVWRLPILIDTRRGSSEPSRSGRGLSCCGEVVAKLSLETRCLGQMTENQLKSICGGGDRKRVKRIASPGLPSRL